MARQPEAGTSACVWHLKWGQSGRAWCSHQIVSKLNWIRGHPAGIQVRTDYLVWEEHPPSSNDRSGQ